MNARLAFLPLMFLCGTANARPPALGDALPAKPQEVTFQGRRAHVLTESGATLDSYRILSDGIHYVVGADQSRKIAYITGGEESFKTPEGAAVGSSLTAVLGLGGSRPIKVAGWGYYVPLPSGWNAAFVESPENPAPSVLSRTAKVGFLFKSVSAKRR